MLESHELAPRIVLGFQPGGRIGKNGRGGCGVAVLRDGSGRGSGDADFTSHVTRSVDEAVTWFAASLGPGETPAAAGIAAPLFWETGPGGGRRADRWLQRARPEYARAIRPLNAVMGATLVQGMAVALRQRQAWPMITLNETRPDPLLGAFSIAPGFAASRLAALMRTWSALNDAPKERSAALLSAWWTAASLSGPAPSDLALLAPRALMPAGQATSFWPLDPAQWLAA